VGLSPLSSERLRRPRAAGAASSTFDHQHLLSPPASFLPTLIPTRVAKDAQSSASSPWQDPYPPSAA